MYSYQEIAQSPLLYSLVIAGLLAVALLCIIFYKKTYKRALELGISKETLKAVNKSTLTVSVIPSVSIVIGLISLSAVIGLPWAWFRLSVVGAVSYELIAAQMATAALGFEDMTAAMSSDAQTFGAVMLVMSIGIIAGIVTNAFIGKKLCVSMSAAGKKKGGFGPVMNSCFMMALMCVMLPYQSLGGLVPVMVIITSFLVSVIIAFIIKKTGWKWLGDFTMAFTLIFGMASALLWTKIF